MGVIIGAGMMGGLALMLANLTKEQHRSQKKAETGVEVVALSQRIVRTLYDGDACMQTLGSGTAIDTSSGAPPLNVGAIKNKNGRDIVVTGNIYGNRLLKVSSIQVTDPVLSGDTAEAKLKVVMERTNRAYTGEKTVTKDFELTLNLDTSANPPTLVGCATGGGELIAMCNALGGTWGGGRCALAPPPSLKPTTGSCGAGEAMTGVDGNGDAVCVALSAGQATAPGVPPGCFPKKSELAFWNTKPSTYRYWHALKRTSGSMDTQVRNIPEVGCSDTYSTERVVLQSCFGRDGYSYCVINTYCCLQ